MPTEQPDPHQFYTPILTPQEHACLAALLAADSLDYEIGLLRILIRRQLALPPIDKTMDGDVSLSVDVRKITRYVYALCHAIKARRLVGDNARDEIDRLFPTDCTDTADLSHLADMYKPVRVGESLMDRHEAAVRAAGFDDPEQAFLAGFRFSSPSP